MSGTLRQARILSSETDNTIKQEQNTNVNIKISKPQPRPSTVPLYPEVPPASTANNINFTPPHQPQEFCQAGEVSPTMTQKFPSVSAATNQIHERGIADLGAEMVLGEGPQPALDTLEKKNKFLELLVEMYSENPLKINSYVVCKSKTLMDMIKLLTECEKVEIMLDDSDVGCGCSATNSKIMKVDKIIVTKDNKSEDLKYSYNDIYIEFVKYGISLKLVA